MFSFYFFRQNNTTQQTFILTHNFMVIQRYLTLISLSQQKSRLRKNEEYFGRGFVKKKLKLKLWLLSEQDLITLSKILFCHKLGPKSLCEENQRTTKHAGKTIRS